LELVKSLQAWEDEQAAEVRESEFQQRVLAASYGPHDPKLYWRIFEPDEVPGEEILPGSAGKIIQPTSVEEFEAMLDEWEAAGALEALQNLPQQEFEEPWNSLAQDEPPDY
jgi:hypothetical protein